MYYWPGLPSDVRNMTRNCQECNNYSEKHKPEEVTKTKTAPIQHVEAEIFQYENEEYLIMADRYSGYVVTKSITNKTANKGITQMEEWFNLPGWPHSVGTKRSDKFDADFTHFCERNNITHSNTNPDKTSRNPAQIVIRSAKKC